MPDTDICVMGYNTLTEAPNHDPGLSTFWFSELDAFYTIAAAPSGTQIISGDHVFPAGEGFKKLYHIPEKHTGKGATVGTLGSATLKNEFDIFVPGIDTYTLEFVKKAINDRFITLHRDADCDNPLIYQLGNACKGTRITCDMAIGTFEPTGEKGFTLKISWAGVPYIYPGVITLVPSIFITLTYSP